MKRFKKLDEDKIIPDKKLQKKISIISQISLIFLFLAIGLVYIFSILKFLYNWIDEPNEGPLHILDRNKITQFLINTGFYTLYGRYIFIFVIISLFIISVMLLLLINRFSTQIDTHDQKETIIIHDDIIQINPQNVAGQKDKQYHPETFVKSNGFYTINQLFNRSRKLRVFLRFLKYTAIISLFGILYVFYRGSELAPSWFFYEDYLYTDEAAIIIDLSMLIFILLFLFHCPDFLKSFSSIGHKRLFLKRFHIHESFIGILLSLGGILLLMNGAGHGAYFERMCGILILILGIFMIGRDWKDFVLGRFLNDD